MSQVLISIEFSKSDRQRAENWDLEFQTTSQILDPTSLSNAYMALIIRKILNFAEGCGFAWQWCNQNRKNKIKKLRNLTRHYKCHVSLAIQNLFFFQFFQFIYLFCVSTTRVTTLVTSYSSKQTSRALHSFQGSPRSNSSITKAQLTSIAHATHSQH